MFWRTDPGPCPICGAAHTACTAEVGPIAIVQLSQRDAASRELAPAIPLVAEVIQESLPPGAFTTGTYRRKKPGV